VFIVGWQQTAKVKINVVCDNSILENQTEIYKPMDKRRQKKLTEYGWFPID
jgi:hypothetical protein